VRCRLPGRAAAGFLVERLGRVVSRPKGHGELHADHADGPVADLGGVVESEP
jgi:hypothetical protein